MRREKPSLNVRSEMVHESFQADVHKTGSRTVISPPSATDSLPQEWEGSVLGKSVSFCGELSGDQDALIEGQVKGSLNFQECLVTVGPHGRVKADIHARRVVVQGSVNGNISATEKIEIHRTGEVLGGLVAPGIAIEDGAYLKGSIEILREKPENPLPVPSASMDSDRKEEANDEVGQSSRGTQFP